MDERSGPPEVRDEPELGLPHTELGVVGEQSQVGRQSQLEPGPDRVPLDRGDDDRRYRAPDREAALEARDGVVEPIRDGELEDVGLTRHTARREHLPVQAGGEGRPLRPDHDDPDLRWQRLPHLRQREPQRRRLRVARLRVREGQGEDRAVVVDPDPRVDV